MDNPPIPTPKIPLELLKSYQYSSQVILAELSGYMTDNMLLRIAEADYGYRANACYGYLKKIVATQQTPTQVDFILTECLELTRWITPKSREEHITRAFSCALLLILENTSTYESISDENETLATLLDSITTLKIAFSAAQELIVWRILSDYEKEKKWHESDQALQKHINEITINPFFIYGFLLLLVFNQENEADIDRVLEWNINMEKYARNLPPFRNEYITPHMPSAVLAKPFLLGTTNFKQRHDLWKSLTQQMTSWKAGIASELLHQRLDALIDCILNKKAMPF